MKRERYDRFKYLAEKRVTKALKDIRLIGNLSNSSNYSYEPEDVAKIYRTLKRSLEDMKRRFDSNGRADQDTFKL